MDDLWAKYVHMIQNYSNTIFLDSGHDILFIQYKGILNFCSELLKYIYRNLMYSSNLDLNNNKYLLLCSSIKKNVEPIYKELYDKLNKNYNTANYINFSSQKLYFRMYIFKSLIISFYLSIKLLFISYKYKEYKFKFRFAHVFINIFYGLHFKYIAKHIFLLTKPKVIIVNSERNSKISTILNLVKSYQIRSYFICNELPGNHLYPLLSNNVFFWDDFHLNQVLNENQLINGYIIGNYEVQNATFINQNRINSAFKHFKENEYILFLDDYDGNLVRDKYEFTIKYNQFMYDICKQNPEKQFIFKNRQFVKNLVPGQNQINQLSNTIIYNGELDLSLFLSWNKIKAVGGVSSQGLYVSSQLNIPTFRLFFKNIQKPIPIIDHNVQLITNHSQFNKFLKNNTIQSNKTYNFKNITDEIVKIITEK